MDLGSGIERRRAHRQRRRAGFDLPLLRPPGDSAREIRTRTRTSPRKSWNIHLELGENRRVVGQVADLLDHGRHPGLARDIGQSCEHGVPTVCVITSIALRRSIPQTALMNGLSSHHAVTAFQSHGRRRPLDDIPKRKCSTLRLPRPALQNSLRLLPLRM